MNNEKIIKFNDQYIKTYCIESISDFNDDENSFIKCICDDDKEIKKILDIKLINKIKEIIIKMPFPLTIIYEPYYVDQLYRDEYYTFYSKKHFGLSRNTKRLVLISGQYTNEDFIVDDKEKHKKIEKDLIGTIVIKPTKTIGRVLINPFRLIIPNCYVRTTRFEISVLGNTYSLEAFPLSGQDSEVMTCAEVNIWQIMEYFGCRYRNYKTLLPSEMLELLMNASNSRELPSEGLTVEQESHIFKNNGLSPIIYYKRAEYDNGEFFETYEQYPGEPTFEEILHFYVESGIPLLLNLKEKHNSYGENHCVTCIGHSLNNDKKQMKCVDFEKYFSVDNDDPLSYNKLTVLKSWTSIDEYVMMEDHSSPYQVKCLDTLIFSDKKKAIEYELDSFVVPLYKHVFMVAEDAYEISINNIRSSSVHILNAISQINGCENKEIVIRLFLTTSRAYKQFRTKKAYSTQEKAFFSQISYPKFIWVCEYGTIDTYRNNVAIGEFVIDATASKHTDPIISIRHGSNITYRGPMDTISAAYTRRSVPLEPKFDMFIENNLKSLTEEGRL